jgi:hypothetical protein
MIPCGVVVNCVFLVFEHLLDVGLCRSLSLSDPEKNVGGRLSVGPAIEVVCLLLRGQEMHWCNFPGFSSTKRFGGKHDIEA